MSIAPAASTSTSSNGSSNLTSRIQLLFLWRPTCAASFCRATTAATVRRTPRGKQRNDNQHDGIRIVIEKHRRRSRRRRNRRGVHQGSLVNARSVSSCKLRVALQLQKMYLQYDYISHVFLSRFCII